MQAQRRLKIHHVALEAWCRNVIRSAGGTGRRSQFRALDSMKAQPLDLRREARVACGDAPPFAGRHVLVRVEAEDLRVAKASDATPAVLRTDRMCGVLEHAKAVTRRERIQRVLVHWESCEVHGHENPRPLRN